MNRCPVRDGVAGGPLRVPSPRFPPVRCAGRHEASGGRPDGEDPGAETHGEDGDGDRWPAQRREGTAVRPGARTAQGESGAGVRVAPAVPLRSGPVGIGSPVCGTAPSSWGCAAGPDRPHRSGEQREPVGQVGKCQPRPPRRVQRRLGRGPSGHDGAGRDDRAAPSRIRGSPLIGKITTGSSGRRLVRYLFGPGKANEHTDQRVITSGLVLGGEALAGGNLSHSQIADLGAGLDEAHEIYGTDPKGGHILHLSLSLPPGDRHFSDDQWGEIANKEMAALVFESDGVQPAAWVAVGHGTSVSGNQHVHIAASLVRIDGGRVNTWQSKKVLSGVCAEIETTYDLTVVGGRAGRGMPGLTRVELERTAREQRAEPPRVTLARIVRKASIESKDEAEFVRRLRDSRVLVRPRFGTGGQDTVVGFSVALKTTVGEPPVWFGGGKLSRYLTLPNLRQSWDRAAAVAEWR